MKILKEHIFFQPHNISINGQSYKTLYFTPDPDIAYAWNMAAKDGIKFTKSQIDWFEALKNHEVLETEIMENEGLPLYDRSTWTPKGYAENTSLNAHDKANDTYVCPKNFPDYDWGKEFESSWNKNVNDY